MERSIVIAAFSDVHGPRHLQYLKNSIAIIEQADLVLVAGDIVDKGAPQHCRLVMDVVRSVYKGPVYAIFGNEEYDEIEKELRSICSEVLWLKDELVSLEVKGISLSIIGTRGILDEPTAWQRRNIPNIKAIYERRLKTIVNLLVEAKKRSRYTILLTHYAPICSTLNGERPSIWTQMGSRRLTEAILRYQPELVIHGHAHNSAKTFTQLGLTKVYNVALPPVKRVTSIELPIEIGLEKFF
ncbi:MAG: metallophosphoesterase [Thermofilaceae archaeon]